MLQELLSPLLAYAGGYRQGLSNHLPMALQALAELGADEAELRRHAASCKHLEPLDDDGRDIADTGGWLGDPSSEAAWRRRFAWERESDRWQRCWPQRLRLALEAPASASFHGLIRLSYAVRGGVAGEIDAALAYALSHWRMLPMPGRSMVQLTLAELMRDWQSRPIPPEAGEARILDDIEQALAMPELQCRLPPGLLAGAREQRRLCRLLFLAARDFKSVHLITAWEAGLSLARGNGMGEVPDCAALQMQMALLGTYIYDGCPVLPQLRRGPLPSLEEIRRLAREQPDDHSIKLALSCLRLAEMDGDAAWMVLATEVAAHGWPERMAA
ncbi:hypothetical protein CXB49_21395 [Chromobacterium sp. ATCC 53434]|uniref:questin oxidase family protein n=1 Tax=Chromobacterium TaxID=535 RepID=UPI000C78B301|nr:questin oxidase family protein [Chromobacterium sp. ATCC 53434]AUH53163.1 hypothetical protein CXB49_21395 [Chromobacterium sp. ATCC 53434]